MKTIPQASVDSQVLGKFLCKLQPGEEVSYQSLSAITPGRVFTGSKKRGDWILKTAIRYAKRELGIVIERVRGKGIKRLEDTEVVALFEGANRKIRKTCATTSSKIICADYDKLSNDDKAKFNTNLSVLGAIQQFTTKKAYDVIGQSVSESAKRIGFDDTIALFKK